jgi:hypothetical protein
MSHYELLAQREIEVTVRDSIRWQGTHMGITHAQVTLENQFKRLRVETRALVDSGCLQLTIPDSIYAAPEANAARPSLARRRRLMIRGPGAAG